MVAGIFRRSGQFVFNITWKKEMSTEAVVEFVKEFPGELITKTTKKKIWDEIDLMDILLFFLKQRSICITKV
jgi:hypothetical protein